MDSQNILSVESKKCSSCKVDKPLIEFHKKKELKDGFRSKCKICISKWQQEHYSKPDIKKARIERQRKPEYRLQQRKHHLKKYYGITLDDYDTMLKSQNNSCATCKTKTPSGTSTKYFHVDHCHTTNKVRGLLCSRCNMALGILKEDMDVLSNLILYLKDV